MMRTGSFERPSSIQDAPQQVSSAYTTTIIYSIWYQRIQLPLQHIDIVGRQAHRVYRSGEGRAAYLHHRSDIDGWDLPGPG